MTNFAYQLSPKVILRLETLHPIISGLGAGAETVIRSHNVFVALSATALAVSLVVVPTGPSYASPASAVDGAPLTALDNLAVSVDTLGQGALSSEYGGIVEDAATDSLTVYLSDLDPGVEQRIDDLDSVGAGIAFRQTPRTLQTLDAIHAAVTADADQLQTEGVDLVEWWPEIRTGVEDLDVVDLSEAERSQLEQLFGADAIDINDLSQDDAPDVSANRVDDSTPRNGGTSIDTAGETCSPITNNGHGAMMTASHCLADASDNDFVDNLLVSNSGTAGTGDTIGQYKDNRQTGSGSGDAGTYDTAGGLGGSSDKIWTGTIGSAVLTTVKGQVGAIVDGMAVCNDGSYSGEVCEINVTDVDICSTYSTFRTVCGLIDADTSDACSDACIANQLGDSGGPVIKATSGGVDAVGIVSGHQGDVLTCQYNATTCYATLLFYPISSALSWSGASLNTG